MFQNVIIIYSNYLLNLKRITVVTPINLINLINKKKNNLFSHNLNIEKGFKY